MQCFIFYCHKFTVFILILILSTTAELLICGKALPRINMITSMPSPTIFLSALINLTYTYFGLTFSLIGQESTEEFLGARIMPYYSKEKKGGNLYKKCHFLEETYNQDLAVLQEHSFCFCVHLKFFFKMYVFLYQNIDEGIFLFFLFWNMAYSHSGLI